MGVAEQSRLVVDYLLETDLRIRIFHHIINMGCWRSRLDGVMYSRGKYIILFDAGESARKIEKRVSSQTSFGLFQLQKSMR